MASKLADYQLVSNLALVLVLAFSLFTVLVNFHSPGGLGWGLWVGGKLVASLPAPPRTWVGGGWVLRPKARTPPPCLQSIIVAGALALTFLQLAVAVRVLVWLLWDRCLVQFMANGSGKNMLVLALSANPAENIPVCTLANRE